jgi:UDP-N-acetylmuramoyl-tripeptide--D-alanyl-D-alanine ligase
MRLPLGRIAEFIGAAGEFDAAVVANGYSIDSRTIAPGEVFFAVKGERLDGHDFVASALAAGAVAAVVLRDQAARYNPQHRLLAVADPLAALQRLGTAVRRLWGKRLIAVTGSTGKTTTKEAIAQVLRAHFRVLKSEGNLNNHFGLPLQLLRLEPEHEIAVIEIGMNHAGEIRTLAGIAHHDVAVVTNVGPVHLEFFDSVAAIARAKYELIETLHAGGTAVLNADDEYVFQFGRDFHGKVLTFGIHRPADVRAENIEECGLEGSTFDLLAGGCRQSVQLPLLGLHNVYNALAAATVGMEAGISPSETAEALAALSPQDKRGELIEVAGATVINDCYNSNPKALEAMVSSFARLPTRRRIVVAGEMLELGPSGPELHRQRGIAIAKNGIDVLLGVRGAARQMVEGALAAGMAAEFVETPQQAGEWLAREVRPGDTVLLKASRGVKLEGALETWRAHLQAATAK